MHWRATSFDETKARCVIRKRCCWIPEHPVVHHGPTHVPVLLQGSVVWGVHVPGREWLLLGLVRRREAPLPSLWTRPLFSLSMLDLSLSAFSDCRPGIPSVSDVQSLQLRAINRTLNEFCMLRMCMRVCKRGSSSRSMSTRRNLTGQERITFCL